MNPLTPPPEAYVFWLPENDTSAIALVEPPAVLSANAEPQPIAGATVAMIDDGDPSLRYDLGGGQHLQLVRPASASTDVTLGAFVPLGIEGFDRLEAIGRLLSALHGRAVPPDTRLTRQQRARSRRMLQAFDGHRAGATQQEIAQVVFRITLLKRDDWQASSARHAIKSLLRDARAMIAGGYRTLLRHRRQS